MTDTAAWASPEGGNEDMPRPPALLGSGIPVPYGREAQTDARCQADAEGAMSDELDMSGYLVNSGVSTIGNEKRSMGWEKNTVPSGGPPNPLSTSGSRGADDIGKL